MNKKQALVKVNLYLIADKKICKDKNIEEVSRWSGVPFRQRRTASGRHP
jgi:hypothetical protein